MRETEIAAAIHKREREKADKLRQWTGLRKRLARLNARTMAWYMFLTLAGTALYKVGAAYALRERGYYAVGGEALALLLPMLYYIVAAIVRDFMQDAADRR